jgi:hypothetical protein
MAHSRDLLQAEEKLLTFSITRCTAASATMSESLLKQRLNEYNPNNTCSGDLSACENLDLCGDDLSVDLEE